MFVQITASQNSFWKLEAFSLGELRDLSDTEYNTTLRWSTLFHLSEVDKGRSLLRDENT